MGDPESGSSCSPSSLVAVIPLPEWQSGLASGCSHRVSCLQASEEVVAVAEDGFSEERGGAGGREEVVRRRRPVCQRSSPGAAGWPGSPDPSPVSQG